MFAANERLISLNRTIEARQLCKFKGLPDAMGKEPGTFLRDAKVTVELHAGDALPMGLWTTLLKPAMDRTWEYPSPLTGYGHSNDWRWLAYSPMPD